MAAHNRVDAVHATQRRDPRDRRPDLGPVGRGPGGPVSDRAFEALLDALKAQGSYATKALVSAVAEALHAAARSA
jgi:hypothetical protein